MNPKETLIAARNLITDPNNWTYNAYSRDIDGNGLMDGYAEAAVCWCAVGAIEKAANDCLRSDAVQNAIALILPHIGVFKLETFNDQHNHEDVLDVFDVAIAAA